MQTQTQRQHVYRSPAWCVRVCVRERETTRPPHKCTSVGASIDFWPIIDMTFQPAAKLEYSLVIMPIPDALSAARLIPIPTPVASHPNPGPPTNTSHKLCCHSDPDPDVKRIERYLGRYANSTTTTSERVSHRALIKFFSCLTSLKPSEICRFSAVHQRM